MFRSRYSPARTGVSITLMISQRLLRSGPASRTACRIRWFGTCKSIVARRRSPSGRAAAALMSGLCLPVDRRRRRRHPRPHLPPPPQLLLQLLLQLPRQLHLLRRQLRHLPRQQRLRPLRPPLPRHHPVRPPPLLLRLRQPPLLLSYSTFRPEHECSRGITTSS